MRRTSILVSIFLSLTLAAWAGQNPNVAAQDDRASRDGHAMAGLKEEVRHELVMMPYYSVFDWFQAEIQSGRTVVLTGSVTRPTLKNDAEARVKKIEGVTQVVNKIEVLPLSNFDDDLRVAVYRSIYRFDSPLAKYALQAVGPIHIIVKNGHVTLKGVVATQQDSQLAYMAARSVPGAFEVKNELVIESDKPIS